VLGYPDLVELPKFWATWEQHVGSCWGIGTGDATELRGLAGDLNATIGAAIKAFDAEPSTERDGVRATFVDVNTANGSTPSNDPNLFEPSSGTRHNLCSADPWLNGGSAIDYGNGSFHPKQEGLDHEGALAAGVIAKLNWTNLAIPEATAAAELASLSGGMKETLVAIPGGFDAATWDQNGNIDFWQLVGEDSWTKLKASTYPILGSASLNPPNATVTGALLVGMSQATFVVQGSLSGDGTANAVVFGPGPSGYGTLVTEGSTSLVSTGQGYSSISSSGADPRDYDAQFQGDELITEQNSGAFDNAFGAGFPTSWTWHWVGNEFQLSSSNIVTAQSASAPSLTDIPIPSATPPNGTYAVSIIGANEVPTQGLGNTSGLALNVDPVCNNLMSACDPATHAYGGSSGFVITVPPYTPTIYPEDAPGSYYDTVRYITGPAWPIAGFAGEWGAENADNGPFPWNSPEAWNQAAETSWLIPSSLVLAGSGLLVEANTSALLTFSGGTVTNIFIDDPLGGP